MKEAWTGQRSERLPRGLILDYLDRRIAYERERRAAVESVRVQLPVLVALNSTSDAPDALAALESVRAWIHEEPGR